MTRWTATPQPVAARRFTSLPAALRRPRVSPWSAVNARGHAPDCFLEGPVFAPDGNLLVTDIPNGRIFRIDGEGGWTLAFEYDGWPNGLKFDVQGLLHVADHRCGLLTLDLTRGELRTVLADAGSTPFKGLNDLHFAPGGELYFTDQGQTGWHDPAGRVFRFDPPSGRLSCLTDRLPSPNGLVLNAAYTQLYVAVTRANAVWRLPLLDDGSTTKVGTFIQMSGGAAGPDGLALDREGGLVVAHPGTSVWRFDPRGRLTHVIDIEHDAFFTNLCFGAGEAADDLFITDAMRGEIWRATLPLGPRN